MKAVNLIPADARRGGGGGAGGRSGGAAYVLLGGLAVLVAMVALYTLAGKRVDDKRAELAKVEQQAQVTEQRAAQLQAYTAFASLRERRVATVTSIAASRFDWSASMHEIARTIPSDVWLTALTGTVAPGVSLQANAASNPLRSAVQAPAVEIVGCTTSQDKVSQMMAAMRQVAGVRRVTLASSIKAGDGGSTGGGGGTGDCTQGSTKYPKFQLVVFFDPKPAPTAPAATGTTATPGATTAATTTTTGTGQ